jgi:hypothetical protein
MAIQCDRSPEPPAGYLRKLMSMCYYNRWLGNLRIRITFVVLLGIWCSLKTVVDTSLDFVMVMMSEYLWYNVLLFWLSYCMISILTAVECDVNKWVAGAEETRKCFVISYLPLRTCNNWVRFQKKNSEVRSRFQFICRMWSNSNNLQVRPFCCVGSFP